MFAKAVLSDEEKTIDHQLGYPRGYAKLCRHAHVQGRGLISPFTEGPPQRFHPYAVQDEEITKIEEYDDIFPILDDEQRDADKLTKHIDYLWQRLDHMANAGFDPAIFRVDTYGNVLYKDADPGSPLAWDVDHWFPKARGGKTIPGNLRLVQRQVCQKKGQKLEFLVPWWDLQLGVSVNHFVSVFATTDAGFRHRAFSYFFISGEDEQVKDHKVVRGHSWPRQFKDRKTQVGLAAAALTPKQNVFDRALQSSNTNLNITKHGHGYPDLQGNCVDTMDKTLQAIVDYWTAMNIKETRMEYRAQDKENSRQTKSFHRANSFETLQMEQLWRRLTEEEKRQKSEKLAQLEEEMQMLKVQNVQEKAILDQLEDNLAKQKKRVEKQRQWLETQSQYRLCLEKMIRDTLHQCAVYKEQARLNQAACNALLARLDSQKSACDAAEEEFVRKVKHREDLEASVKPHMAKRVRHHGHSDVGSCLKLNAAVDDDPQGVMDSSQKRRNRVEVPEAAPDHITSDKQELGMVCPKLLVRNKYATRALFSPEKYICEDACKQTHTEQHHEDTANISQTLVAQGFPKTRRKALETSDELEVVLLGYEYQTNEDEDGDANREESVGDNGTTQNSNLRNFSEDEDEAGDKNVHKDDDDYDESNNGGQDLEGNVLVENANFDLESNCQRPEGTVSIHDLVLQTYGVRNERTEELPDNEKNKDDEKLDDFLQEVLALQDRVNEAMVHSRVNEAMVDAIQEERDKENVKRLGKRNLDKWLQKLLLDSRYEGQDEANTMLFSCSLGKDSDLSLQNQAKRDAGKVLHQTLTNKNERGNFENEVCNASSEVADAAVDSTISGLLKKMKFKNEIAAPHWHKTEDPQLVVSAKKSCMLTETKRPVEQRSKPWWWTSPTSKRSVSAGSERRLRHFSPWRRNTRADDKTAERKMMEDFRTLKLEGNASRTSSTKEGMIPAKESLRSSSGKQNESSHRQRFQERSASAPRVKGHVNRHLAVSPIPSKSRRFAARNQQAKVDIDDIDGEEDRSDTRIANRGESRKEKMLKNYRSVLDVQRSKTVATGIPASARIAPGVCFKEMDMPMKASMHTGGMQQKVELYEDLVDPQDEVVIGSLPQNFDFGRPTRAASFVLRPGHLDR